MSKPGVVHVVNSLSIGGLENGVVNLVNDPESSFRHTVVCMSTGGPLRERLRPDVEVHTLEKRSGRDLGARIRLVRLLRRLRPEIVHSRNWATFDAVLAARLARVPMVVHGEHGRDINDPEGRNGRRNRWRRRLSPVVTQFVAVSEDLRRWLVEDVRLAAGKVVTIHNGVDCLRFGSGQRGGGRERFDLPGDAIVVGTVGRLDPVKDQASLIRAFAAVAGKHPRAVLALVGDGPCRGELAALVEGLGLGERVRLLGERHDIPRVLAGLDVFVLPSIAEGLSNTILEAMATGLPVIATRVGGNPELVEDGVTGRLVPVRDHRALVEALEECLDDSHVRALRGKASAERVLQHFSIDRMRRKYEDLYTGLRSAAQRRP